MQIVSEKLCENDEATRLRFASVRLGSPRFDSVRLDSTQLVFSLWGLTIHTRSWFIFLKFFA